MVFWLSVRLIKYLQSSSTQPLIYVESLLLSLIATLGTYFQMMILGVFSGMISFLTKKFIFRLKLTLIVILMVSLIQYAFMDYFFAVGTDPNVPLWYLVLNILSALLLYAYCLFYELFHGIVCLYCLQKIPSKKVNQEDQEGANHQAQLVRIRRLRWAYFASTLGGLSALVSYILYATQVYPEGYEIASYWAVSHAFISIFCNSMLRFVHFPSQDRKVNTFSSLKQTGDTLGPLKPLGDNQDTFIVNKANTLIASTDQLHRTLVG